MTSSSTDPYIGRVIANNFKLTRHLGGGAMGRIYLAEQLSLGRTVCIKLLHEHLLGDQTISQRFHREALAASRLRHPNIIQIADFGQTDDGLLFMAMEYVDGVDLGGLLARDFPLDNGRVIHILKQVADALDEAHAMGVVHRDLKPENIMVQDRRHERDYVTVLDFGIAKIVDPQPGEQSSFQTQAGMVCGTPEFMSPEQARGEKLDARSDLYAMGVLLFQLLTDNLPFSGETAIEVVTRHLREAPPSPRALRADVPKALEELTLQLLEKDPNLRPPSALTVRDELENIGRELEHEETMRQTDDRTLIGVSPFAGGSDDDADKTIVGISPLPDVLAAIEEKKRTSVAEPADTRLEEPPKPAVSASPQKSANRMEPRWVGGSTETAVPDEDAQERPPSRALPIAGLMLLASAVVALLVFLALGGLDG